MKKNINKGDMKWEVYYYNMNSKKIGPYNVLAYMEEWIKKVKKECSTISDFSEKLKREMMYRYWSKAEWELIIWMTDNGDVFLAPWCGCSNPEECTINISQIETDFDWAGFASKYMKKFAGNEAKIDVYKQLEFRWNEFVDYCWYFKHKYQRYNPKFGELP